MSLQRRRGEPITFYPAKKVHNNRGEFIEVPDEENRWETRCAESHDRSSRMEVPGQGEIEVISVLVSSARPVTMFSRAKYLGEFWDIVGPPARRRGVRATRHQTVLLRKRPGPKDVF